MKEASKIYKDVFMKILELNQNNFTHKSLIKELIEYTEKY